MATGSPHEADKLWDAFDDLGFVPKHDTPEELMESLKAYVLSKTDIKIESDFEKVTAVNIDPNTGLDPCPSPDLGHVPGPIHPPTPSPIPPPVTQQNIVVHQVVPPRISFFSGDIPATKGDVTFEQWGYEVHCLLEDRNHSLDSKCQTIRKSLKGEAGQVAMRLGPDASIQQLIKKLQMVYDTQDSGTTILSQFYSARQEKTEDVTKWGFRLESLMHKAIQLGEIQREKSDALLRKIFWNGLRPSLKDISGHKYDTINDFDELRVAIKRIEAYKNDSDIQHVHAMTGTTKESSSELNQLKGMIQQLTNRFDKLETERKTTPTPDPQHLEKSDFSIHHGQQVDWTIPPPTPQTGAPGNFSTMSNRNSYYPQSSSQPINNDPRHSFSAVRYQHPSDRFQQGNRNDAPVCYRCGQVGHIQIGCRVLLDHYRGNGRNARGRGHLNQHRPMRRGHP